MNLENFIGRMLEYPSDMIAYSVSRKLAAHFDDRVVIEGEEPAFDPVDFARAGHCEIVGEPRVHTQTCVDWRGARQSLHARTENAWLNVLWEGHLLDVVLITWTDEGYRSRFFWIAADSREVAEGYLGAVCEWCSEARGEVLVFEGGRWRKDEQLFEAVKETTFDTLVLPSGLETELRAEVDRFFASRETYERYRVAWKRGLLLTGPPGNGKTHAVKAVVNASGKPCLYVRSFSSWCSTVDANMRLVFERARRAAPCVLVFEDLDALVDKKSRSYFLNELDGFAPNPGILTIATSNYPEQIDPALVDRPGRFDRRYDFDLPAKAERRAYAERWNAALEPEMRASADGLAAAVAGSKGFSFAYLKEALVSSTTAWVGEGGARSMDAVLAVRVASLAKGKNNHR